MDYQDNISETLKKVQEILKIVDAQFKPAQVQLPKDNKLEELKVDF